MPGGDPGAQSSLADAYYEGAGVGLDLEQAARWYRAAANGGDEDAWVMLGMMYADCDVDMDDDPDAERWLRVAADAGHDPARYLLGELGVAGYPTIDDDDETPGSYRAASEQDAELARAETHAAAPEVMATGLGATPEEVRAMIDKARQAAWRGDPVAQYLVAMAYHEGLGLPQDDAEALRWFRAAARQGDPVCQNNVGVMYQYGEGVAEPNPSRR